MTQRPTLEKLKTIRESIDEYCEDYNCEHCEKFQAVFAEIDALIKEVEFFKSDRDKVQKQLWDKFNENQKLRAALTEIAEEPNRMGLIADEVVKEYDIKAWHIAHEALIEKCRKTYTTLE